MDDLGALIERCLINFLPISRLRNIKRFPTWKGIAFGDLDYLKASLESVGPERCIAATDGGEIYNPSPLDLSIYLLYLLEELGCSAEEISNDGGGQSPHDVGHIPRPWKSLDIPSLPLRVLTTFDFRKGCIDL